jgi:hypothetical protein
MAGSTDLRNLVYEENVRAPTWLILALGLFLGGAAGVVSAVAIRSLVGEPLMEGGEAALFYTLLTMYALLDLFLLVNFTNLAVTVSPDTVEVRFGLFSKTLQARDIRGAEPRKYSWAQYGGWGLRLAMGGRRAWSMLGVPRGVLVTVAEAGGAEKSYFISSRDPDSLAAAINSRRLEG